MCRADVEPQARAALVTLVGDIAKALADQARVDVATIRIGPVDFGHPMDGLEPHA
jgi:hypothetical protein